MGNTGRFAKVTTVITKKEFLVNLDLVSAIIPGEVMHNGNLMKYCTIYMNNNKSYDVRGDIDYFLKSDD